MLGNIRKWLAPLTRSSFLRDVVKLSLGTIGGRLVSLAALPLVTRLYSPEDYALLAVYIGAVSLFAVAACGRLEVAIPLADADDTAASLLVLSLVFLGVTVTITALLSMLAPLNVAELLGSRALAPYLWLVPFGVLVAGSYSVFQYWSTRARRFGAIARTRISQAILGVVTIISFGWAGIIPFGLLLGNLFNIGAGGFSLAANAIAHDRALLGSISWAGLRRTLKTFRGYPLISTPEALLNVASVQVPILMIASHAGAEAGHFLLAMQVMSAPMTLLGKSISQVFISRAPEEMRQGRLASFTFAITRRLALVGLPPIILIGLLAPLLFPWAFGADWARAGVLVAWMVPWIALQFITSPISTVMYIADRQRSLLALTASGAVLKVGAILLAIQVSPGNEAVALVLASTLFYAICLFLFMWVAKNAS